LVVALTPPSWPPGALVVSMSTTDEPPVCGCGVAGGVGVKDGVPEPEGEFVRVPEPDDVAGGEPVCVPVCEPDEPLLGVGVCEPVIVLEPEGEFVRVPEPDGELDRVLVADGVCENVGVGV